MVGSCLTAGAGILNLIDELRGSGISADGALLLGGGAGENAGPSAGATGGGGGAAAAFRLAMVASVVVHTRDQIQLTI